jgi:hypothetical protein
MGLAGQGVGDLTVLCRLSLPPCPLAPLAPLSSLPLSTPTPPTDSHPNLKQPLVKMGSSLMRRSVRRKAGFDIGDVSPLDLVGGSVIPAVFGHAVGDSFIRISHSGGWGRLQAAVWRLEGGWHLH